MPHPKVCNWVRWGGSPGRQAALYVPRRDRCGAADSLARGHGGLEGTWALVPLFGVLLTVHHISDPKVTSHPEVKATVCAGVALWVAEVVIRDAHGLCAVERWTQSRQVHESIWQQCKMISLISNANQLESWRDKHTQTSQFNLNLKEKVRRWHISMFRSYWLEMRDLILFFF